MLDENNNDHRRKSLNPKVYIIFGFGIMLGIGGFVKLIQDVQNGAGATSALLVLLPAIVSVFFAAALIKKHRNQ